MINYKMMTTSDGRAFLFSCQLCDSIPDCKPLYWILKVDDDDDEIGPLTDAHYRLEDSKEGIRNLKEEEGTDEEEEGV